MKVKWLQLRNKLEFFIVANIMETSQALMEFVDRTMVSHVTAVLNLILNCHKIIYLKMMKIELLKLEQRIML